jgi:cation diffusion facilitator CzcD-associated flavoprotein CzcO
VVTVSRNGQGFGLELSDGSYREAARVIVAAGISPFPGRPRILEGFPSSHVSHSSEHDDLTHFRGQRVLVIGGGQSALESAALLHERGAHVEVLARGGEIRWLSGANPQSRSSLSLGPPTDVGGPIAGWLAAAPDIFRRIPRSAGQRLAYRCIRPAGSGGLKPRLSRTRLSTRVAIRRAQQHGDQIDLELSDGSRRAVDHVLLGTGFQIDVKHYPFLDSRMAEQIRVREGYPLLAPGLESSVPGLHFLGAPAALSFGPVMRFVVGTWYCAPAVARRVLGKRQPRVRLSF